LNTGFPSVLSTSGAPAKTNRKHGKNEPALAEAILPMKPADYPEMIALASLTEPGPFRDHTAKLGGFVGRRRLPE
jgi:hypothetical protein